VFSNVLSAISQVLSTTLVRQHVLKGCSKILSIENVKQPALQPTYYLANLLLKLVLLTAVAQDMGSSMQIQLEECAYQLAQGRNLLIP
jgi:hypothetical protein